jgi:hypothetical protein
VRLRGKGEPPSTTEPVESPYDPAARFRHRGGASWVGYIVHTIRTQSIIRLGEAPTPRRWAVQRDDMADLQAALVNDDALDDELQHRLLLGERGLVQPATHPFAEGAQIGQYRLCLGALPT